MDADGGNQVQVASTGEIPSFWSLDGDRVYFARRFQGIFWVDVAGPPTQSGNLVTGSLNLCQPDISPDGSTLTFKTCATLDKLIQLGDFVSNGTEVTNIRTLFTGGASDVCSGGTRETILPAWAPDGMRIAFGRDTASNIQDPHTILLDGTGCLRVTNLSSNANNPRWSPDSNWLTFSHTRSGNPDVHVVPADGSAAPTNLINDGIVDVSPDWSPDLIPSVDAVVAPAEPVPIGTGIAASGTFSNPNIFDTHTALWDWGDDSTSPGTVSETNGSGTVSGTHTYAGAGVYTVTLTVTDDDGESDSDVFEFVVVFHSSGGFVTGGGWIDSPEGAYVVDPTLTGKANFGFVSKYRKGATIPTGQTEFQFHVAHLNFHSDSYDWLVIAGPNAKYKGTGTINGSGDYGFMLTACDVVVTGNCQGEDDDTFRIKIWDKDAGDAVIYDNITGVSDDSSDGTVLGGGNVKVHTGK